MERENSACENYGNNNELEWTCCTECGANVCADCLGDDTV